MPKYLRQPQPVTLRRSCWSAHPRSAGTRLARQGPYRSTAMLLDRHLPVTDQPCEQAADDDEAGAVMPMARTALRAASDTTRTMQTPGIVAAVDARVDTRTAVSSSWHRYSFSLVVALFNRSTAATCSECHRNPPRDVLMPRAVSAGDVGDGAVAIDTEGVPAGLAVEAIEVLEGFDAADGHADGETGRSLLDLLVSIRLGFERAQLGVGEPHLDLLRRYPTPARASCRVAFDQLLCEVV